MATAQQLASLVQDQQAAEAAGLEDRTADGADGGAGAALSAVLAAALAAWVKAFGSLAATGATSALVRYLAGVRRDTERAVAGLDGRAPRVIEASLAEAAAMGARHAFVFAGRAAGIDARRPEVSVPSEAVAAARDVAAVVRVQLRLAARFMEYGSVESGGWPRVVAGIGAARRAVSLVRQAASWAVHRAVNSGSQQAAEALGALGLWVAEPTACVRCAAYSGTVSGRDGMFPGGLSLDPNQRAANKAAIEGPPIHPHDRCRVVPWRPEWAPRTGPSLPDLLREQAWRSAAVGRAAPSESRAARLRSARYVSTLRGVPAGVQRQARAAAAAGHF